MDCDKCGKPAKVHLTQLVGGQVKKIALCNECANSSGVTDPTGFALADLLLTPGQAQLVPKPPVSGRRCPDCGFSLDDLQRVRRLGCGTCYATFRDEVSQMVRGMHKGAEHLGKVPHGQIAEQQRRERIEDLRGKLETAVRDELYELAAAMRDEIRQLENEAAPAEGAR